MYSLLSPILSTSRNCFQDSKLPLFTLILGIYLFITPATAISTQRLAEELDINRKSAQLFNRKMRILMTNDNQKHKLDAMFIESDAGYIEAKSRNGKRGLGTTKAPVIVALSLNAPGQYPRYIKLDVIHSENTADVKKFFNASVVKNKATTVYTDGKTTFHCLNKNFTLHSQIIEYQEINLCFFGCTK